MFSNIWKLGVPKERVVALIEKIDADQDGFVSFGEVRKVLQKYAKAVKRSARFGARR